MRCCSSVLPNMRSRGTLRKRAKPACSAPHTLNFRQHRVEWLSSQYCQTPPHDDRMTRYGQPRCAMCAAVVAVSSRQFAQSSLEKSPLRFLLREGGSFRVTGFHWNVMLDKFL